MDKVDQIILFVSDWFWLPLLLIYLGIILTILIENRNPTKTIAWILVIVFLPLVGMILYYLFGQKFRKIQSFRTLNIAQSKRLMERWGNLNPIIEANLKQINKQIGPLSRVYKFLANQHISPLVLNNRVDLLINGEQKFPALIQALEEAQHHIHLEYYIFEIDRIGQQILEILKAKAREGVEVRLLVDAFGSPRLAKQAKKLRKEGIEVAVFLPVDFSSLADSNYRNHRKLALVDGQIAFVGGINIDDRYINSAAGKGKYWRDTSVRIEGYSVNVLQAYFWMDWHFAGGQPFEVNEQHLYVASPEPPGQAAVSYAFSDPGSEAPYCMEALLIAISEAEECIRLCTPYYIPSDELDTALQLAAASGIRVELMIPHQSDSYIMQHASLSYLKPLLRRNVSVYLYEKGFIHAKTVSVDGKLAFVGTVNLDTRSFYINFETSVLISEPKFCKAMVDQFEFDKTHSTLLTRQGWWARPKWKRSIDSICRLLAPLL
ncbi:MAG TPA: cardiolipin synthase [Sphingobacteriaceae bacterium]|nr:cardiolipin synthase [Sphingobacteriaceae bacterium]